MDPETKEALMYAGALALILVAWQLALRSLID